MEYNLSSVSHNVLISFSTQSCSVLGTFFETMNMYVAPTPLEAHLANDTLLNYEDLLEKEALRIDKNHIKIVI